MEAKDTKEFRKRFLTNTDDTGRFIVTSFKTGKKYFVEAIDDRGKPKKLFGDVDPATKKLTGDYGNKFRGAIRSDESMITKENGFDNITVVSGDPFWEIDRRDREYERSLR